LYTNFNNFYCKSSNSKSHYTNPNIFSIRESPKFGGLSFLYILITPLMIRCSPNCMAQYLRTISCRSLYIWPGKCQNPKTKRT